MPEEDETHANQSSILNESVRYLTSPIATSPQISYLWQQRYETVRHIPPPSNGHILEAAQDAAAVSADEHVPGEPEIHVDAPSTPPAEEPALSQERQQQEYIEEKAPLVNVNVHQPPVPSPQPIQTVPSGPDPRIAEIAAKDKELSDAKAEIERLRSLISSMPEPSTVPPSEFTTTATSYRRRPRSMVSDDDDGASTLSPTTEFGSYAEDTMAPPEGVPLQVVIIIAIGVFVTTYLFF